MISHSVDFIGGDFTFSTVGDVFSDPEFAGSWQLALVGASVARTIPVVSARVSSSCRGTRTPGGPNPTVATGSTTLTWALGRAT